jgi:hypothetical protein
MHRGRPARTTRGHDRREHRHADHEAHDVGDGEDPAAEQLDREDRLRDAPFVRGEDRQDGHGYAGESEDLPREPGRILPAAHDGEQAGQQRYDEQAGANVVYLCRPVRMRGNPERDGDHREYEQRDRQRDQEHPAPVGVVGDPATAQRSEDRAGSEGRPGHTLPPAAVTRRDEVADDGHGERDQRAGAEALDAARPDELRHRATGGADDRAGHEENEPEQDQRTAAVDIGQSPIDRHGHCEREHARGEHPRVVVDAAEVLDDPR